MMSNQLLSSNVKATKIRGAAVESLISSNFLINKNKSDFFLFESEIVT